MTETLPFGINGIVTVSIDLRAVVPAPNDVASRIADLAEAELYHTKHEGRYQLKMAPVGSAC
ncbi:hypothetical protein ACG83_39235 [Frankia sp. R43]|nr:hypothetical protein ACG83_39235 [Frankia sp. R43]